MQLLVYRPRTSAVWADALFASMLQRSDQPSAGQVRKAITATMRSYGGRGCAERVAQEFGDHPETAVARMGWARGVVGEVFAAPGPAQDGRRKRPGLRVPGVRATGPRTCQRTRATLMWCGPRRWPGPGHPAPPGSSRAQQVATMRPGRTELPARGRTAEVP